MKAVVYIFFLSLISFFSFAQIDRELYPPLSNRVTYALNDTLFQIHLMDPSGNGKIHKDRNYYWFRHDTILITMGGYGNHLLTGDYKSYYPGKNLFESGLFEDGEKTGTWKTWYPSGTLKSVVEWNHSLRNGPFEWYDSAGKKIGYGSYKEDKMVGTVFQMNAEGVMEKKVYDAGEEVTPGKEKKKKSSDENNLEQSN